LAPGRDIISTLTITAKGRSRYETLQTAQSRTKENGWADVFFLSFGREAMKLMAARRKLVRVLP
jgi:hypothetical protein